jgi:hypothetical protein
MASCRTHTVNTVFSNAQQLYKNTLLTNINHKDFNFCFLLFMIWWVSVWKINLLPFHLCWITILCTQYILVKKERCQYSLLHSRLSWKCPCLCIKNDIISYCDTIVGIKTTDKIIYMSLIILKFIVREFESRDVMTVMKTGKLCIHTDLSWYSCFWIYWRHASPFTNSNNFCGLGMK